MRTIGLLLVVLGITYLPAGAQETDAPQGALIEAAEVSGIRLDQLSPGLRKDIEALANTTLDRGALDELASRIEEELPDVVTAVRAVSRPAGAARVVFLVARISDDDDLVENINTRYMVERVETSGVPDADVPQDLRDALAGVDRSAVGLRRGRRAQRAPALRVSATRCGGGLQDVRDAAERDRVVEALNRTSWNVSSAARLLGVERTNLHKRIRALGLSRE